MASQSTRSARLERSASLARILDATKAAVILNGVRRTTVQDIATRAGISRMTFYRRLGSVDQAVLQTLTREIGKAVAAASERAQGRTGRHRLVSFALEGVRLYAADEMVSSILERDPELLIPYLSDRFGASQELVLAALPPLIEAGVADGSIEARATASTMILLLMQSSALPARILQRRGDYEAVLSELELLLHRYLAPTASAVTL